MYNNDIASKNEKAKTMYKEIRKLTGNNKTFAAMALETLKATCWWITGDEGNIAYFKNSQNDWVAIPDVYSNEGAEFYTVRGATVTMEDSPDGSCYIVKGA